MKTAPSIFVRTSILICCAISTLAQVSFQSAEVTLASDVQFPAGNIASGIAVVDVSLDSKGEVTGTDVQRDIPPLTSVATSSLNDWKYVPTSVGGTPRASLLRVAFAFRPHVLMATPPIFEPLQQEDDAAPDAKSGYIPPGIAAVTYPAYPIDAASVGAVVVQVKVGSDGKTEDIKVIRAFYPFTRFAVDAAQQWQFRAATLNAEPVPSNIVIAFVYSFPIETR